MYVEAVVLLEATEGFPRLKRDTLAHVLGACGPHDSDIPNKELNTL